MKRTILAAICLVLSVSAAWAQKPNMSVYGKHSSSNPFNKSNFVAFMEKLDYSAEVTMALPFDSYSKFSLGGTVTAIHHFNDTLHVGLGAGLWGVFALQEEIYSQPFDDAERQYGMNALLPVYAQLKVSPMRFDKWTPFVKLNVGAAIRLNKGTVGGFMFEPMLGSDYKISKDYSMTIALGTQWLQTGYLYTNYMYEDGLVEKIGAATLGLQLHVGLNF